MPLYDLDGHRPVLPKDGSAWIAPGAQLIGQITMGANTSVWFNAVLRGDNEPMTIGAGTNVQDGCVFHTDPGFPLDLGTDVTVGHMALLHGCSVGDGSLIGMGAVVLNGARIGRNCLIGANALITEGKEIPDGSMVVGQPGRVIRTLDDAGIAGLKRTAEVYKARSKQFSKGLSEVV